MDSIRDRYYIKPCPFCDSEDVDLINVYDNFGNAIGGRMVCYSCDITMVAENVSDELDLIEAWNNRPER